MAMPTRGGAACLVLAADVLCMAASYPGKQVRSRPQQCAHDWCQLDLPAWQWSARYRLVAGRGCGAGDRLAVAFTDHPAGSRGRLLSPFPEKPDLPGSISAAGGKGIAG